MTTGGPEKQEGLSKGISKEEKMGLVISRVQDHLHQKIEKDCIHFGEFKKERSASYIPQAFRRLEASLNTAGEIIVNQEIAKSITPKNVLDRSSRRIDIMMEGVKIAASEDHFYRSRRAEDLHAKVFKHFSNWDVTHEDLTNTYLGMACYHLTRGFVWYAFNVDFGKIANIQNKPLTNVVQELEPVIATIRQQLVEIDQSPNNFLTGRQSVSYSGRGKGIIEGMTPVEIVRDLDSAMSTSGFLFDENKGNYIDITSHK